MFTPHFLINSFNIMVFLPLSTLSRRHAAEGWTPFPLTLTLSRTILGLPVQGLDSREVACKHAQNAPRVNLTTKNSMTFPSESP